MAGHSKFKNIMHRKGAQDKKRSNLFSKLSREITVAAKMGAPDPDMNPRLRLAINTAKGQSMPKDNIQRAIDKANAADGENYEEVRYEGYGPGGVAVLIEALTDNRNRAAAELRSAFGKNGGNLGETGCVGWMFAHKGVIALVGEIDEDVLLEDALEAGAESYELADTAADDDTEDALPSAEVYCDVPSLETVSNALKEKDYSVQSVDLRWIPDNTVQVDDIELASSLLKMMDALEESDDVQSVTANFEMSETVMEAAMA